MEVPTGRHGTAVTELRLNHGKRLTLPGELGCMGVPQSVRVNALLDPGLSGQTPQQAPNPRLAGGPPVEGAEHGRVAVDSEAPSPVQPASEEFGGGGVEPDDPVTVTLAVEHPQGPAGEVKVLRPKGQTFSQAQARAPQRDDERAGPEPCGSPIAGGEQPLDLVGVKRLRRELPAGSRAPGWAAPCVLSVSGGRVAGHGETSESDTG